MSVSASITNRVSVLQTAWQTLEEYCTVWETKDYVGVALSDFLFRNGYKVLLKQKN